MRVTYHHHLQGTAHCSHRSRVFKVMSGSAVSDPSSSWNDQTFPVKLYQLLCDPQFSHIISWMPHGLSWKMHQPKLYVNVVMPRYFEKQSKLTSFTRQVNGWGFKRVGKSLESYEYYNEFFIRGQPHLIHSMRRIDSSKKGKSSDKSEPTKMSSGKKTAVPVLRKRERNPSSGISDGQEQLQSLAHSPHSQISNPIHFTQCPSTPATNMNGQLYPYFTKNPGAGHGYIYQNYNYRPMIPFVDDNKRRLLLPHSDQADKKSQIGIDTEYSSDQNNMTHHLSPVDTRSESFDWSSLNVVNSPLVDDSLLFPHKVTLKESDECEPNIEQGQDRKEVEPTKSQEMGCSSPSEDEFKRYICDRFKW